MTEIDENATLYSVLIDCGDEKEIRKIWTTTTPYIDGNTWFFEYKNCLVLAVRTDLTRKVDRIK